MPAVCVFDLSCQEYHLTSPLICTADENYVPQRTRCCINVGQTLHMVGQH